MSQVFDKLCVKGSLTMERIVGVCLLLQTTHVIKGHLHISYILAGANVYVLVMGTCYWLFILANSGFLLPILTVCPQSVWVGKLSFGFKPNLKYEAHFTFANKLLR